METKISEILKIYDKIYHSDHPIEKPGIVAGEAVTVATGKTARQAMKKEIKDAAKGAEIAAKEGAETAAKATAKEGVEATSKTALKTGGEMATKEGAKGTAKIAAKTGNEAAIKEAKEGAQVATKEAAKEGAQVALKEVAKEGAKIVTKEVAKEGAKAAAKTTLKKIPIISAGAGLVLGAIRVGVGTYHCVKGETSQGVQEFCKAPLEVASGIAGSFPGVGTAVSFGIDAGLSAWDIGNAVHGGIKVYAAGSNGSDDSTPLAQLHTYLLQVSEAIKGKQYTNEAFLSGILESTYKKFGSTDDGKKAAENGLYIYGMVEKVFDNEFFDKSFSMEKICKRNGAAGFQQNSNYVISSSGQVQKSLLTFEPACNMYMDNFLKNYAC